MTTRHSIARLGSVLCYWVTGSEGTPLIVLVHGATMDHQTFDAQVPALVEAGYRALVIIGATNLAKKSSTFTRFLYCIFPGILSRMSLDEFRKRTLANLAKKQSVKDYAAQAMKSISRDDFAAITLAGIAALWLDSGFPSGYVIPKPFLLTHGAQDRANGNVYAKQAKAWAAQEHHCRYEIIPDAGHTAHMDNPMAFNAVLLDFLKTSVPW